MNQGFRILEHWLSPVVRTRSPNYDNRPDPADISLLVIHSISLPPGEFGGNYISSLFCNRLDCRGHSSFDSLRNLTVSSHLLIRRDGGTVQFVAFDKRAWHAGQSCFEGRQSCNDFAVGIELEGCDTVPYSEVQYHRLAEIISVLSNAYPKIHRERIVGHSDIAAGRKTDPGPMFDWPRLASRLRSISE